jgi:hypothetical protein
MKTMTRRATTIAAAGALGLSGLVVAAPALAGAGPFGPGSDRATVATAGATRYGMGMGAGACMGVNVSAEQGTLSAARKAVLGSMAQEEKLALDLYTAFGARYGAMVFDHIAVSETEHLTAVRTLLQRYGVTDPTANLPSGTFTGAAVQSTYDKLLRHGSASLPAALAAGQQVERDDIAALTAGLSGLTAPDVKQVYADLLTASQMHLNAFTRWSHR